MSNENQEHKIELYKAKLNMYKNRVTGALSEGYIDWGGIKTMSERAIEIETQLAKEIWRQRKGK